MSDKINLKGATKVTAFWVTPNALSWEIFLNPGFWIVAFLVGHGPSALNFHSWAQQNMISMAASWKSCHSTFLCFKLAEKATKPYRFQCPASLVRRAVLWRVVYQGAKNQYLEGGTIIYILGIIDFSSSVGLNIKNQECYPSCGDRYLMLYWSFLCVCKYIYIHITNIINIYIYASIYMHIYIYIYHAR